MGLIKGLLFWGYLDDVGKIYVKRYTSDRVIENYEKMPFCRGIFGPTECIDFEDARQKFSMKYEEVLMEEKRGKQ